MFDLRFIITIHNFSSLFGILNTNSTSIFYPFIFNLNQCYSTFSVIDNIWHTAPYLSSPSALSYYEHDLNKCEFMINAGNSGNGCRLKMDGHSKLVKGNASAE